MVRTGQSEKGRGVMGLYLHVPFCATKCNYCDFNTYAGIEDMIPAYVASLTKEISLWGRLTGRKMKIGTVFFGGGTPSYLPLDQTRRILQGCSNAFSLDANAEITVEANPDDLTIPLLKGLLETGVNRLSIGVQSFKDRHLIALTRRHSAQKAIRAFGMAREAGFRSINIDLMYGLPHQSLEEWEESLSQASELVPEHLSLYALTLEEGTPLWAKVERGAVPEQDADLAADMYLHAEETLERFGYLHYEISNWAKPGHECQHNLVYWRNQPYLGLGAGAHSYYGGFRFSDEKKPWRYIERVQELASKWEAETVGLPISEETVRRASPIDQIETIYDTLEIAETMMLGLRLGEGVSHSDFYGRFGRDMKSIYGIEIDGLKESGLLVQEDGTLRLTQRGRLLGNEVFSRFLSVKV